MICIFKWFVELYFFGCSFDYIGGFCILLMKFYLSFNILFNVEYISK